MTKPLTKLPTGRQLESTATAYRADPDGSANLLAAAAGFEVAHDNVVPFRTRKAWRDDG